jgi:hypothetical protein
VSPDDDFTDALAEPVILPAWFVYVDLDGDPIRVTTSGYEVSFPDTDDDELGGGAFDPMDPTVIEVGEVSHREGGSEPVTIALSGILTLDQDVLDAIADRTKWQGRVCRLWVGVRDGDGAFLGPVVSYYTGWMTGLEIVPGAESQTIKLSVQNYLTLLQDAPNRTWLDQKIYDADDISPEATLAAINGARSGPGSGLGYGGAAPSRQMSPATRSLIRKS